MATFLRSPATAPRVFGIDTPGQLMRAVPRVKFLFWVEFKPSAAGLAMLSQADLNSFDNDRGISFKVRQIDKPKVTLTAVELNQYNKKKLAYSKIDYGEVSIRMYDAVDNSALALWVDYFTYYFGDSRRKTDPAAYRQSPVDQKFVDDSGWGLRPISDNTQFFDKISIYAFYANTYTKVNYINPRITLWDFQQKDYSSSDLEEITVNFKYEAIEYEQFGVPFNRTQAARFGWSSEDQLNVPQTGIANLNSAQPRIFSAQESMSTPATIGGFTSSPPVNGTSLGIPRLEAELVQTALRTALAPGASVPAVVSSGASLVGGFFKNFGSFGDWA